MEADKGIVSRIIGLMRAFADGEFVLGIKQLSERLHLPPSTLHRLLDHLVEEGIVERAPHHRYRIGMEFFRLGCRVESKFRIMDITRPVMQRLVRQFDETCTVSIYLPANRQRLPIAKIDPPNHSIKFTQPVLESRSLVWGAVGRSILAHLPEADIKLVHGEAPAVSPVGKRLPKFRTLLAELEAIRVNGYAFGQGELLSMDTVAVAVPFFNAQQLVQGALCMVIPTERFNEKMLDKLPTELALAAYRVTMNLGGRKMPAPKVGPPGRDLLRVARLSGPADRSSATTSVRATVQPAQSPASARAIGQRVQTPTRFP